MTTPGPVAKATEPAPAATPQASSGTNGAAPQGGGSPARAMQAPAVKDTLGPAEAPAAAASPAAAAKESAPEPAKAATVPAPASKAPAATETARPATKEPANEAPASAPAPAAKEVKEPVKEAPAPAPAPAPVVKETPAAKEAPAAKPAPTPKPAAPKPTRSEAPVPKSKLGRTRGTAGAMPPPRVRRARLKIANIDPWSVMKVSFLFSVALGIILLVAVTLLWVLLDFMGFFATVAGTIEDISKDANGGGFDVVAFFSLPRVLGMTTIVALIDIILITALATLAAYLYNLSTDLVGGVEVTLAEEE